MDLVQAGFNNDKDKYRIDLVFRNPVLMPNGKTLTKQVSMGFRCGMNTEEFTAGLRELANHIDNEVVPSLKIVTG